MKDPHSGTRLDTGRLPRRPAAFDIRPDAPATAALAARLGLSALSGLRFSGTLSPADRLDWALEGHLTASVTQPCVVTLAPVVTRIDERVSRRYVAGLQEPVEAETEMPADDTIEPLPRTIDLLAVMTEALDLALPLYPRSPDAAEPAAQAGAADDAGNRRPFAGLGAMLGGPDRPKG
ncbi:MAG: DUF177 domain-containing protein [Rhodobacteraceae bacterium]|nr:DUF177 domain-containing protein [Paracoccaceae bacterium]